jgi:hypothetical protein
MPQITKHDTSTNGARAKILRALRDNGMMTINEIVMESKLTAKQVQDNGCKARTSGLISSFRDEISQQMVYQITEAGCSWLDEQRKCDQCVEDCVAIAEDSSVVAMPEMASSDQIEEGIGENPAIPEKEDWDLYAIEGHRPEELIICGRHLQEAIDLANKKAISTGLSCEVFRLVPVGTSRISFTAQFEEYTPC